MEQIKRAAFILLLVASIGMSMLIGQEDSVVPMSPMYFAIVLPALVIPFLWLPKMVAAAIGKGWSLVAFGVLAGGWQLILGEYRTMLQLALFVWVLLWILALDVRLSTRHYLVLFAAAIAAGIFGYLVLGNNPWGVLPGTTSRDYLVWRLSFFPSVVLTGLFALFAAIVVAENRDAFRVRLSANLAAFYFLIFSFVRTALVSGAIYAPLAAWFAMKRPGWRIMFFVPLAVALGVHGFILLAPHVLVHLQDVDLVARLLLRGRTNLEVADVFEQLSRPWIWQKHIEFFLQSPYLMGLGNFDFFALAVPEPGPDQAYLSGSEALLTRLLATYGLPTLLLFWFFGARLYEHARNNDYLGCAIFPVVIILAMNYGSVLHPTNFLFVLYFLLMIHGRKSFAEFAQADKTAPIEGEAPIAESKTA